MDRKVGRQGEDSLKLNNLKDRIEIVRQIGDAADNQWSLLTIQKRGCVISEEVVSSYDKAAGSWQDVQGVAGIVNITGYLFLVAVSKGEKLDQCEEPIHRVKEVKMVCFDSQVTDIDSLPQLEQRYVQALKDFLETSGFYYATGNAVDLTTSLQRNKFDKQYMWNYGATDDFRLQNCAAYWTLNLIQGFVGYKKLDHMG